MPHSPGSKSTSLRHEGATCGPRERSMTKSQKLCVYNLTSECFLSLGVSPGGDAFSHLAGMFRRRVHGMDEGQWILEPKPIHTLAIFLPHDLVLLDDACHVIDVIESWPSFRIAHLRDNAASLLTLPVHTIYSSQTQPGHQLVISVAEEMQSKLRKLPTQISQKSPETLSGVTPLLVGQSVCNVPQENSGSEPRARQAAI